MSTPPQASPIASPQQPNTSSPLVQPTSPAPPSSPAPTLPPKPAVPAPVTGTRPPPPTTQPSSSGTFCC